MPAKRRVHAREFYLRQLRGGNIQTQVPRTLEASGAQKRREDDCGGLPSHNGFRFDRLIDVTEYVALSCHCYLLSPDDVELLV